MDSQETEMTTSKSVEIAAVIVETQEEEEDSKCCCIACCILCCSCITCCCGKAAIFCGVVYSTSVSVCRAVGRGCCGCFVLCKSMCCGCCCALVVCCGGKCGRRTMIVISVLMLLLGLGLFVLGILIYVTIIEVAGGIVVGIVLAYGFFIMIAALLGLFGSLRRSAVFLLCNFFTVLLLIAAVITVVILFSEETLDVEAFLETRWMEITNCDRITIQNKFDCCGFPDYGDNYGNPCPNLDEFIGCGEVIEEYVNEFLFEMAVSGGVFSALVITMLCLSFSLLKGLQENNKKDVIAFQVNTL